MCCKIHKIFYIPEHKIINYIYLIKKENKRIFLHKDYEENVKKKKRK